MQGLPESRKSLHVYSETGVDFLLAAVALIVGSLAYVLYNLVVVPFVMRPGKSEKQSPGAPLPKENGAKTANPSADPGNGDSSDGSGVA